ncbi:MAG: LPXTG cell wall anchor domain-containing protein [Haliscomenobacteraceae bacterium CHB4]|nr:LPXTG cell wall anchor domain-containing protein [Haliscomenobacteraceae bacterium CHB4]
MAGNPTHGKSMFFWIAIFAAVGLALFLIAHFLFPHIIKEFTVLIAGAFAAVLGLVFRRRKKT